MEVDVPAVGRCILRRTARRTLAISVLPDGTVEVVAPRRVRTTTIAAKVARRAEWIRRQRRHFAALHAARPARRYCNGATHRYLGRQYRLKVTTSARPRVALRGAYLHIEARSTAPGTVASLLARWMRDRASEQFERRLARWRPWCAEHLLPDPSMRLLSMPKRWGSTRTGGRMLLNPELVRAPSACIDYVIAHEICHIRHPRHDRGFYATLEMLCPNWQSLKRRLETAAL